MKITAFWDTAALMLEAAHNSKTSLYFHSSTN
jgi:hypothetical protein